MANPTTPQFISVAAVHCGRARMHWTASVDENGQPPKQYEIYDQVTNLPVSIVDGRFVYGTAPTDASRSYILKIRAMDTQSRISAFSATVNYQAPASDFAADLSWPGRLEMSSRHADRWGPTRAVLYYQTPFSNPYIRLIDSGTSIQLTGSSSGGGTTSDSGIAFTSADVFHYAYANRVDTYSLASGFLGLQTFGTGIGIRDIIHLTDGSVLAVFQDRRWDLTANLGLHLALRSPGGVWSLKDLQVAIQQTDSVIISASQHPADGSIWLFLKQDAGHWLAAAKFDAGLNLLTWTHDFLYYTSSPDPNGPNGEYPWLRSFPDPVTNTIALAFTCEVSTIFSNDPQYVYAGNQVPNFVKGAEITVCRIAANATKSFRRYQWMGERVKRFGYSCVNGVDRLMQAQIDLTDMSFQDCYARRWTSGVWSSPLSVAPTRGSAIGFCEEYALVQAPDGLVHALAVGDESIGTSVSQNVAVADFFGKGAVSPLAVHGAEALTVAATVAPLLELQSAPALTKSITEGATARDVLTKGVVSPLAVHSIETIKVSEVAPPGVSRLTHENVKITDVFVNGVIGSIGGHATESIVSADAVTALPETQEPPPALSKALTESITVKDFFVKGYVDPLTVRGIEQMGIAGEVTPLAGSPPIDIVEIELIVRESQPTYADYEFSVPG